jgi:FkbM family methyltransferase
VSLIHSRLGKSVKWLLVRSGFSLIQLSSRFGVEPFFDIKRLSGIWNYPINRFFDVGANEGQTALNARKIFPRAEIFSFEPHPVTYSALTSKLAHSTNIHCFNLALGSQAGEFEMFEYESSALNSMVPDAQFAVRFGTEGRPVPVQCTTLDRLCSDMSIDALDVLKIDTEGFELEVLRGSSTMLQRRAIKFVFVEFNDLQPQKGRSGGALSPIDSLLHPYGFRFIASYNDLIVTEGEMFSVSNALFALPPPAT